MYDALLGAAGGSLAAQATHVPVLRLRLLRSVLHLAQLATVRL